MTAAHVQAAPAARPARIGRTAAATLVLAAVLALAIALSLMMGANPLPWSAVWASLTGAGTPDSDFVVQGLRAPRTIAGLVAGAALGVAGALMQSFSRNPLADPGILGVNAGAAFAVALTVAVFGIRNSFLLVWPAFLGALVVAVAVAAVGSAGRGRADPIRLVLAGVAVGAVLSGVTSGMMLSDPDAFDTMRGWNAGSLLGRGLEVIVPVVPFVVVGLLVAFALGRPLNALALGDDLARAQGTRVGAARVASIASVTVLAGAATALVGPLSFVGLMVPHVVRWIVGPDQRRILPLSALAAPIVVLLADVLGRVIIAPAEVPAGIVTAFVGAPVLIALARRRRARAL
ncbi:iron complex transport system permease protein [Microbacterium testaceum StLB037]|uniref:Iron complex transport system permease protein n=1 Tax=Microbacterium testaceum (strain StLB037) TaxID=979556 RepID=A0A1H0LFH3_MICTS|nr:iron chelate uptake ABC transporter family permease subunit [Microbacterium testaceum]SDO66761.1 iron complex transport system permease protein [Microbacterium testaceum StLB037]